MKSPRGGEHGEPKNSFAAKEQEDEPERCDNESVGVRMLNSCHRSQRFRLPLLIGSSVCAHSFSNWRATLDT